MPDIKLKGWSGNEFEYEGVPFVWLADPSQEIKDLEEGEEANLLPFTYGMAKSMTVAPDFSGGDMAVPIPEGELVTALTIEKPIELAPENIPEGMYIAGVGPGTFQGGGGGGGEDASGLVFSDPDWLDDICFWDFDGTLVHQIPMSDAPSVSALPEPPAHDGLTFLGWNYTLEQVQNAPYPLDIGAMYTTSDGKTHLKIKIINSSYKKVPLNFSQTVSGGVSINWGDGNSSTVSGTGVVAATHTYSAIGEYEIVITVAEGCEMTLGGSSSSNTLVGGNAYMYPRYLTECYIGDRVSFDGYSFYNNMNLKYLTIPNRFTALPLYFVYLCESLAQITVPIGVISLGDYAVGGSNGKYTMIRTVISLPHSLESFGVSNFSSCVYSLRLVIPPKITTIPDRCIEYGYSLLRLFLPDGITSIGSYVIYNMPKLEKLKLPASLQTIGDSNVHTLNSIKSLQIPYGVTRLGNYFLSDASSLEEFIIPEWVTELGANVLANANSIKRLIVKGNIASIGGLIVSTTGSEALREVVILSTKLPTANVNYLRAKNVYAVHYIRDELLEAYKTAVGSTYIVKPLSEYKGILPD